MLGNERAVELWSLRSRWGWWESWGAGQSLHRVFARLICPRLKTFSWRNVSISLNVFHHISRDKHGNQNNWTALLAAFPIDSCSLATELNFGLSHIPFASQAASGRVHLMMLVLVRVPISQLNYNPSIRFVLDAGPQRHSPRSISTIPSRFLHPFSYTCKARASITLTAHASECFDDGVAMFVACVCSHR